MRISTRVSLSLSALAFVVFGGVGTAQVLMEKHDLERGFMRDAATLCQATAQALRQDHDPDESAALLRSIPRYDEDLTVSLWRAGRRGAGADLQGASAASADVDPVALEAIETDGVASRISELPDGSRVAIVAAPIDTREDARAIVIVHPLDEIDADIRAAVAITALSVALFSILGGLVGLFLGEVYIVRPLARLDRAMALVAAGDLTVAPLGGSGDEVGRVLSHFDEMRAELAKAWGRLRTEEDAHRSTLERLADADRLVTVGQLAAGLAHEIGSPLQILGGRARKLVARAEPDGDVAKSASIIVAQTDRITGIVRQLLEFARPRRAQRREVDPVECITPVVDLLELEAGRRGVTIRLHAGPGTDGATVEVDADGLQQVVFNLARNGLAAVDEGGTIEIRIDAVATDDGRILELVVADDGVGISEETRRRAFEPFFTTRAREGGVGLGLAVVRSLVEGMDGTITLGARPSVGTELVVRIPC
jgi:signal transduction histidine kinase